MPRWARFSSWSIKFFQLFNMKFFFSSMASFSILGIPFGNGSAIIVLS